MFDRGNLSGVSHPERGEQIAVLLRFCIQLKFLGRRWRWLRR